MIRALRNRRGVTLVELLAVIVILGIIAAIAVPTIGGLIERQRENAANASYDAVLEAGRLYVVENSGTLSSGDTFLLSAVVTAGYLTENPFDTAPVVTFTVGASGTVSITSPTALAIDGYYVLGVAP